MKKISTPLIINFSVIMGLFIFASFIFRLNEDAQAFEEPTVQPKQGNITAPINISSSTQRKIGDLRVGLGTDANVFLNPLPGLPACNATNQGEIVYYRTVGVDDGLVYLCDGTSFQALSIIGAGMITDFIELNNTQTAYMDIRTTLAQKRYSISGVAANPWDTNPTAGVMGETQNNEPANGNAYGVYGMVAAPGLDPQIKYSIYGYDNDNASAFAGYFRGSVSIQELTPNDAVFYVGTDLNPVSLCLYGSGSEDCQVAWPSGNFWNSSNAIIYNDPVGENIIIGGTSIIDSNIYFDVDNTVDEGLIIGNKP